MLKHLLTLSLCLSTLAACGATVESRVDSSRGQPTADQNQATDEAGARALAIGPSVVRIQIETTQLGTVQAPNALCFPGNTKTTYSRTTSVASLTSCALENGTATPSTVERALTPAESNELEVLFATVTYVVTDKSAGSDGLLRVMTTVNAVGASEQFFQQQLGPATTVKVSQDVVTVDGMLSRLTDR